MVTQWDEGGATKEVPEEWVPVPANVRGLLLRIRDGWTPDAFVLGSVESVRCGDVDLSDLAPQLRLETNRLIATLDGPRYNARARKLEPFPLDGSLEGKLADGPAFHGDMIRRVSQSADMTIEMGRWLVLRGAAPPVWIGRVENATELAFGGNLIVERVRPDGLRAGHKKHFRLSGAYTYYLVQTGTRDDPIWHLVIDTAAGAPDLEVLESDFQLLQFVLGRQLRIPALLGVTTEGQTIGSASGVGAGRIYETQSVPPVPLVRNNDARIDESWAALFFDRINAVWSTRPQAVTAYFMAFDAYLDAMRLHLDADYLRLQIALEAFSYWTLRLANGEERMVVKDKSAWKRWVKDHSSEIRAHASEGFEASLTDKVRNVYRLSSGRVVPSAFFANDLTLTEEMIEELGYRDVVVHQGLMAPDGYDADRDLRRIAMIRTLLVALIAKTVNYAGAINGWEVGPEGYAKEPDGWWNVRDEDRRVAQRTFVADDVTPR